MGFDGPEQITHIGGHALSVTGAQALEREGTDTTLVQLVGEGGMLPSPPLSPAGTFEKIIHHRLGYGGELRPRKY